MEEQIRHGEAHDRADARARIARLRKMIRRAFAYWKGAALVFVLVTAAVLAIAMHLKRVYRSECTLFAKSRIRTDDRDDATLSPDQIARQGARLKDMLTTRARLESTIKKFDLYPRTVANKTMLDAVEEMKPHVGFRSLEAGQYVISFDGDAPETVQRVTQYLSDSLIDEYAAGDLADQRRQADFLALEEEHSLHNLEDATRELTLFLAAHPEFAVEAKQAATPFGPSPASGIPLLPKVSKEAETTSDPALAALYREHSRLEGEAHVAATVGVSLPVNASAKQIDDQIAQAEERVEAAAKRVAETQADLASKSNLTDDHPDMRAARFAADAAARQLHEAKVQLAGLQQLRASGAPPAPEHPTVPRELEEKLHQVDAQIAARKSEDTRSASPKAPAPGSATAVRAGVGVAAVVELETDWQRLLRALNEAKTHHDDLKLRAERAKLAVEAARAEATEEMAIVDPPYRPTHPSKGGRTNVALAGLALALLLALGYAGGRVTLDDTLVDAEDVEMLRLAPVLGVIPKIDSPARPGRRMRMEARPNASV